jgi:mannosyltransferase
MRYQEEHEVIHGGQENYHHMCRFYSGFFYDVPALQKYKWFWRIEPDARYTCSITYDPFIEMEKHGKKYGFTIALWEIGKTAPSLFKRVNEFKEMHHIRSTALWRAMVDVSWLPWPFRKLIWWLPHHNRDGDIWNMCHF